MDNIMKQQAQDAVDEFFTLLKLLANDLSIRTAQSLVSFVALLAFLTG